jgi:hypothetical protein
MLKGIKNSLNSRLAPTRTHWSGLKIELSARLRNFRQGRAFRQGMEQDFSLLLAAWGLDEADIPSVLRDLRLRRLALLLPLLLATLAVSLGLASALTLALLAPPCLLGLLTANWRMTVLRKKTFTPFSRWLISSLKPRSM